MAATSGRIGENMKIIKRGNITTTCTKCGCEFQYEKNDIKKNVVSVREDVGVIIPFYRTTKYELSIVECPQCGDKIEVGVNEL